jgi:innexin
MWQFIDVFKRVISSNRIQDDDFADRLSHRHTVAVLILFTILVSSSQLVGNPISCWCPAHFTGAMVQYTNYICWITDKYYVPTDDTLPNPDEVRKSQIAYYQWVPFILALMAFMYYLPFVFWRFMAKPSGLDAKTVMKIISGMDATNTEAKEKTVRNAVKLIDRAFDYHRDQPDYSCLGKLRRKISRCLLPKKTSGSYITVLYIMVKMLYLLNCFGQFFLLNRFMGDNFNIFGFQLIRDAALGKDFWESSRFPRVTMCDFTIRTLGENNQRNAIQCVLPINLYNEKIFAFIWFWMCIVAALSVYSFLTWFYSFTSGSRSTFVVRYLMVNERLGRYTPTHHTSSSSSSSIVDSDIFKAFLYEYLRQDGIFLLRIVKKNSNDIVVGELVCALWDNFKRNSKFQSMVMNAHTDDSMHKETEKLHPGPNGFTNGYP